MKKKKEGKKRIKWILMGISLILAVGFLVGYLYYHSSFHNRGQFPGENFPPNGFNGTKEINLSESQINEISSFFDSNPSTSDMENYCIDNRGYCFYYCRNINPNSDVCSLINNYTRPDNITMPGGAP
jgi:hypothetical protein